MPRFGFPDAEAGGRSSVDGLRLRRPDVDLESISVYVAARNLVFGLILLTRSRHFGLRLK